MLTLLFIVYTAFILQQPSPLAEKGRYGPQSLKYLLCSPSVKVCGLLVYSITFGTTEVSSLLLSSFHEQIKPLLPSAAGSLILPLEHLTFSPLPLSKNPGIKWSKDSYFQTTEPYTKVIRSHCHQGSLWSTGCSLSSRYTTPQHNAGTAGD